MLINKVYTFAKLLTSFSRSWPIERTRRSRELVIACLGSSSLPSWVVDYWIIHNLTIASLNRQPPFPRARGKIVLRGDKTSAISLLRTKVSKSSNRFRVEQPLFRFSADTDPIEASQTESRPFGDHFFPSFLLDLLSSIGFSGMLEKAYRG